MVEHQEEVVHIKIQALTSMISHVWIHQSLVAVPLFLCNTVRSQPTACRPDVTYFTFSIQRDIDPLKKHLTNCLKTMNTHTIIDKIKK